MQHFYVFFISPPLSSVVLRGLLSPFHCGKFAAVDDTALGESFDFLYRILTDNLCHADAIGVGIV